ncbi:phage tail protein [Comamonas sp. MYb21]|uniref:phage tail protein n=1 Tax=Comamonas sp. MYb21 TaxID=1848648 RepID=UPI0030A2630C
MAGPKVVQRHRSVLPPNASLLERAIDGNLPADWGSLADQAEPAADPDALLPWVAAQWQLGQFDRYFSDPRELLAKGLPWLRERGSAAAVKRAMGWLGYSGVRIEEDGARLHISPGREVSIADMQHIAYMVRASIPLHVKFYRLFHRYDLRRIRLDNRPRLDSGMLDSDSGVPIDLGGEIVLGSQGQYFNAVGQRPKNGQVRALCTIGWSLRTRRRDVLRLDSWRLDSRLRKAPRLIPTIVEAPNTPAYVRLLPKTGFGPAYAITAAARNAQPQQMRAETYCAVVPRTVSARTWTGYWDGHAWQESEIATKFTEENTP